MIVPNGDTDFKDRDSIDLGVVESGKFVAKSFKIFNNSDVPAAYQVDIQCLNLIVLSTVFVLQRL